MPKLKYHWRYRYLIAFRHGGGWHMIATHD
jgi:hypothetical protein